MGGWYGPVTHDGARKKRKQVTNDRNKEEKTEDGEEADGWSKIYEVDNEVAGDICILRRRGDRGWNE